MHRKICCAFLALFALVAAAAGQTSAGAPATDDQARAAGKKLYATSCAFCHGPEGNGSSAAPSLRKSTLAASAVTAIISDGQSGTAMLPFKGTYNPAQIADLTAFVLSLSSGGAGPVSANTPSATAESGAAIYASKCAGCHESGGPPYLNHFVLKAAAPEYIVHMLASGVMHVQGARLAPRESNAVAEYLTGKRLGSWGSMAAGRCSAQAPAGFSGPQWNGWGVDLENSRFQPADQAGLAASQVPNLKLKWAFGFPGGFSAYSQPTVAGGRVYVGGALGQVYALDAATGCTRWSFQAEAGVRTAVTIGPNRLAYFGDLRSNVYAVNALTGKLVWRVRISAHPYARVTGSPRLYKGRLYVPVSSREEWLAASPQYECCTFRGILAALDAATGKQIWRTYTIPDPARPTKKNKAGTQLWGPSGAGLWSSPTIDADRGLIYIGAGNNYSDPETSNSDAVLAIDLKTGKIVWSRQITSGDTYNVSCFRDDQSNCPAKHGPDTDFAAPPILRKLPSGQRVLVVGQKSGDVFGLDPDKQGEILWKTNIGHGGALGGVEWGPAADSEVAYVALSDFGFSGGPEGAIPDPKAGGGLFAIKIATGEKMWVASPAPGGCTAPRCSPAQSAAVSAIPGAVFSGADDGHLRAYSTSDGTILWDFDTAREFDSVNKISARGGSIDGGGPAIAGGMVFTNSGFGALYGIPGNVLLAFGPE
ncbi:MAG TPA: PQQ-binding-like beta-propeller repeat protein [Candidatus Acidoferrales bacterium]|nr:PQQ-binding-like beta-propeller repeat protein [Candidatus Acidoferrales bacterium]